MNHPAAEDDRRSSDDVSDAPSPRSKFANRKRKERVRGYGEGTVYEFERRLPSGAIWRGYRAKRSIKHGERSIRVAGQGKTRQEALANLERNITRKRIALAELPQSYIRLTQPEEARTVGRVLDDWLSYQRSRIGVDSWKGYEAKVRIYLRPSLGETPVRLLTRDDVEDYIYSTLPATVPYNRATPLGKSSIRAIYWTLSAALDFALQRGWVDRNVAKGVEPPQKRKPTRQERDQLYKAARWTAQHTIKNLEKRDDRARWLLAFLGLRQGEVLGLRCSSVKPKSGARSARLVIDAQLKVRNMSHGCGDYDATTNTWPCGKQANLCTNPLGESGFYLAEDLKTPDGRRILPLTDRMYERLSEQVKKQRKLQQSDAFAPLQGEGLDDLLFTTDKGKPRRHQDDRRAWKQLLLDLGNKHELRLHHARHFAATMLIESKADREDIRQILGWSSRTVDDMLKVYGHADVTELLKAPMESLDKVMFSRVDKEKDKEEENKD